MLFPLPLVPFEEYMLRDDRADYPMTIFMRLQFSGCLVPAALDEAVETATARHPLLRAQIRATRWGRFSWHDASQGPPRVRWGQAVNGSGYPAAKSIDLFSEPGLRIWGIEVPSGTSLVLQLHHACCDGKGLLQFVADLMTAYAKRVSPSSDLPDLADLPPEALRQRGTLGLTGIQLLRKFSSQIIGLQGIGQFFFRRAAPVLAGPKTLPRQLPSTFPSAITRRLAADDLQRLNACVQEAGVTVNDWLIRDLFLALADFQSRHQPGVEEGWMRISIPVNLREASTVPMPAANIVSMVFPERRHRDCRDPKRLLSSIHDEMQRIKRYQLGLTFVLSLQALRLLPSGISWLTGGDDCATTSVLSNLGNDLSRIALPRRDGRIAVGNATLDDVEALVPLRSGTAGTFAVIFYAGAMQVCLHYDVRRLSCAQATDLIDTFLGQVRQSILQSRQSVTCDS